MSEHTGAKRSASGASVVDQPLLLPQLVQEFQVCWEEWPEFAIAGHEKRQVGFSIELLGTHGSPSEHPRPGCPHCEVVFSALREIAEWILPKDKRPSNYEIGGYDQAIHYSPLRKNRPDISLIIKILHREGFERPVDECEIRCLAEMKQRLKELGAPEGHWKT